jgi:hypothetical protein
MSHTREPWKLDTLGKTITSENAVSIAICLNNPIIEQSPYANARRIVACVNACAGIKTEHLERVGVIGASDTQQQRIAALEAELQASQQREGELREAMRLILEIAQDNDIIVLADKALSQGREGV